MRFPRRRRTHALSLDPQGAEPAARHAPLSVPRLPARRPSRVRGDHRRGATARQHPCPPGHRRGQLRGDAHRARCHAGDAGADPALGAGQHARRATARAGAERHSLPEAADRRAVNRAAPNPHSPEGVRTMSATSSTIGSAGVPAARHDIVIVGAGAAGIATAASLLRRERSLDIALVDPAGTHYYQPGWTLVGGGVFEAPATARPMEAVLPHGVTRIRAAVAAFSPEQDRITLEGGASIGYRQLIVCPGLELNWAGIEGLADTLGKHGVTSNYRYDLAPYTWQLVQALPRGRAIFTQPPMPIKCAGAPQKAMYLSADHWRRAGRLKDIEIEFHLAGNVLFGVPDYVPALMDSVRGYGIDLRFGDQLVAVDGPAQLARFRRARPEAEGGGSEEIEREFDLLHVVPPQRAPGFVRDSALADAGGWVDVDPATLRHRRYENIHALGDATNTSNAKTAAAARKQAPVVAHNVLAALGRARGVARYDGYGSCPLTVERGRVVLAEFLYGGKVAPTFPGWLNDGTRPSRLAWFLKESLLPRIYWNAMLKGREWFARPAISGG
ncbi:FAD/NAD(P)-binding oxidoreductase [Burkholderia gladioli]|uniref:NAD(P)/FAD-dependent oxidoreductase n=1 Tax=Burkholderia gladioli TaxID=28095 RepID=UPI002ED6DC12